MSPETTVALINLIAYAGGCSCAFLLGSTLTKMRWNKTLARYRHLKRGTTYRKIGEAKLQASKPIVEGELLAIYIAEADNELWARPWYEFYDGRFERID